MTRNDKKNEKITILKKSLISAAVGHIVALVLLFLSAVLLMKNEDPSALLEAVSLVALFAGGAVCGVVAGKNVPSPFGGALSGGIFSALILVVSVIGRAFVRSNGEDRSGAFFMMAMLAAAALLSAVIGFWLSTRKSTASALTARKKKALRR